MKIKISTPPGLACRLSGNGSLSGPSSRSTAGRTIRRPSAPASPQRSPLVSAQVPSLPTRNEWGESWREGNLNKTRLLSPALSSFLRQEEREKCSATGHLSTCVDTNERSPKAGLTLCEEVRGWGRLSASIERSKAAGASGNCASTAWLPSFLEQPVASPDGRMIPPLYELRLWSVRHPSGGPQA